MKKFFVITFALITAMTLNLFSQQYVIDAKKSELNWFAAKVTGKHNGKVNIKDGSLKKEVAGYSGVFTVDMTSIKVEDLKDPEYNTKLVNHLRSDDFFSVDKHKTTTFKLKSIKEKKTKDATHTVVGDLTIKGITNEITFPAKFNFSENSFKADAKFSIDRSKWNVRYGSGSFFDNLGDATIYDDIKFELSLVGNVSNNIN